LYIIPSGAGGKARPYGRSGRTSRTCAKWVPEGYDFYFAISISFFAFLISYCTTENHLTLVQDGQ
jgi:hypothetical protein